MIGRKSGLRSLDKRRVNSMVVRQQASPVEYHKAPDLYIVGVRGKVRCPPGKRVGHT